MPNTPCGNSSISPAIARFDAVDARDAVADRDDGADFGDVDVDGVAANLVADDLGDFFGLDVHKCLAASAPMSFGVCISRVLGPQALA